jgi:hypothetical protein
VFWLLKNSREEQIWLVTTSVKVTLTHVFGESAEKHSALASLMRKPVAYSTLIPCESRWGTSFDDCCSAASPNLQVFLSARWEVMNSPEEICAFNRGTQKLGQKQILRSVNHAEIEGWSWDVMTMISTISGENLSKSNPSNCCTRDNIPFHVWLGTRIF